MASFKSNIAANLAGQAWAAVVQILFIPLYVKFLGIEGYGLIGFYLILQSILQVADLGLSPTMIREMARYSAIEGKTREMRDLVRTLESVYWVIGLALALCIVSLSPLIASDWITSDTVSPDALQTVVVMMGALAFLQWPISLYQGGLMGLHRQVLFNVIRICSSTIAGGGAVLVLWLWSPTIHAFFGWQLAVSLVHVLVLAAFLWKSLPAAPEKPRFQKKLLLGVFGFAAGMSGLTLSGILLSQGDKLLLSKLLDLEQFGYYMIAATLSTGLILVIGSLYNVFFPHFSAFATQREDTEFRRFYHQAAQIASVLIMPVAGLLVFFSFDILRLWTGNIAAAENSWIILSLLAAGTTLNCMNHLPYALQLSYGWTSLTLKMNLFLIIVMVPLVILLTTTYGPVGAASVWVLLNASIFAVSGALTHRRVLRGEAFEWYVYDVGVPALSVLAITVLAKYLFGSEMEQVARVAVLGGVFVISTMSAILATGHIRAIVFRILSKIILKLQRA